MCLGFPSSSMKPSNPTTSSTLPSSSSSTPLSFKHSVWNKTWPFFQAEMKQMWAKEDTTSIAMKEDGRIRKTWKAEEFAGVVKEIGALVEENENVTDKAENDLSGQTGLNKLNK
ncbi:uncharacterized protein MONOS_3737 [Monocercomonoides exilis]|uniref:uncharacterized protein n=1 Tax=Monocercomonoides exilis TaxID=2049356 RepID=UPI00355A37FB|nr:hypothetical protein MONOS_3737 [Monocercomonoides exilis]|eukprot:MONOS_3737.1-p1 / transcript=MONOS_3737.1 / gene=MONOS_3737 / organism=Monocercomonoides_exilis_PA203 / gene_product=unspecified product / transcript_product=unspecified product / location=Mono_scaffold00091:22802-23759(+) / protein_length=114 / sequence_SO=supercontig / SO=protein_coding / is_pseudo=false